MDHVTAAIIEQGRASWPEVALPNDAVTRLLAGRPSAALPSHPADLYLAVACAEGVSSAIRVLEQQFLSAVGAFVARIDRSSQFVDEVKQRLRERLLVGPPPRISEYSGDGPLGAWLRVVSVRAAIDLKRIGNDPLDTHDVSAVATQALDPELQLIRNEHRHAVERSLRNAIVKLSAQERNVLRMYFAGSWSLDQIGKVYGVHRATVCRWIGAIRERLLADLAGDLGATLGLGPDEIQSYTRMLRSRLDADLSGDVTIR